MTTFQRMMRRAPIAGALAAVLSSSAISFAAEASADVGTKDVQGEGTDGGSGGLLLAGKVGGVAEFNHLSPYVVGGVEVGYGFGSKRRLAVLLDAEYTAPKADGDTKEDFTPPRVPGGTYTWEIQQKQLALQPTLLYRLAGVLEPLTPYAGIGPRVFFVQTTVKGKSGDQEFPETTEQSTNFGFGIPLGVEIGLGPGGLLAELLFQWAPLDQETTGESHLGGLNVFLGYRALL